MTPEMVARFWAKVDKSGDCWIWKGCVSEPTKSRGGYGCLTVGGRRYKAHRLSWELHNAKIQSGLSVLHRCDVRACVNPAHLFLGTHVDNMRDMYSKGRGRKARGAECGQARLSDAKVRLLRAEYAQGVSVAKLAKDLAVSEDTARRAITGRTWRHVGSGIALR